MNKHYLKKFVKYTKKVYHIENSLKDLTDRKKKIIYTTGQVVLPVLLSFLLRIQSFNEHKYRLKNNDFKNIISKKIKLPQIDTIRAPLKVIDIQGLYKMHSGIFKIAKQNKIFKEGIIDGYTVAAIDGTKLFGSYKKSCEECCTTTTRNKHTHHFHSVAFMSLIGEEPYILHPLGVMFGSKTEVEQIYAVLHDVIEDTAVTLEDLRSAGFKEEIIIALDALTKRKNETYDDCINRVMQNQLSCHVKLVDLSDNMNLSRIPNPSDKNYKRIEKYHRAAEKILDALNTFQDNAFVPSKEIEINGCISVPEHCTEDEVLDKFINFIESSHWYFGGVVNGVE